MLKGKTIQKRKERQIRKQGGSLTVSLPPTTTEYLELEENDKINFETYQQKDKKFVVIWKKNKEATK